MPRSFVSLLALLTFFTFAVQGILAAPAETRAGDTSGPAKHFDDPSHVLPRDEAWFKKYDKKLSDFQKVTGLKIIVQFHPKSPPAEDDKVPGAYMHSIAEKMGTVQRGALVVYFADEDDWRVWVGDETTPLFVGQTGTAKEFTDNGKMHEVKEAFLKSVHEKGEAAFAAEKPKAAKADPSFVVALRVKFLTEALLDNLMIKLGPY